jgi:hypothetical protein
MPRQGLSVLTLCVLMLFVACDFAPPGDKFPEFLIVNECTDKVSWTLMRGEEVLAQHDLGPQSTASYGVSNPEAVLSVAFVLTDGTTIRKIGRSPVVLKSVECSGE